MFWKVGLTLRGGMEWDELGWDGARPHGKVCVSQIEANAIE